MAYVPPEFEGSSGYPPPAPDPFTIADPMNEESGIGEEPQNGYESDESVVSPMNPHHINPTLAPAQDQIVGPLEIPWWFVPGAVRPDPTGSNNLGD